jgi:cardiolipin synthase
VVIEDPGIGEQMSRMFLEDLDNSTEIVITPRNRVRPAEPPPAAAGVHPSAGGGKYMLAGVLRVGSAINAAVKGPRTLSQAESSSHFSIALVIGTLALICFFLPRVIAYPVGVVLAWSGLLLLVKALRTRFGKDARRNSMARHKARRARSS